MKDLGFQHFATCLVPSWVFKETVFLCWVGVNTSQPTVAMEIQAGQDNVIPLILNAGDSHQHQNLQLSPTTPPLTLSQVLKRKALYINRHRNSVMICRQATNTEMNAF